MPNTAGQVPAREVLTVKADTPDKVRKKDLTEGRPHTTLLKSPWIQVMWTRRKEWTAQKIRAHPARKATCQTSPPIRREDP